MKLFPLVISVKKAKEGRRGKTKFMLYFSSSQLNSRAHHPKKLIKRHNNK